LFSETDFHYAAPRKDNLMPFPRHFHVRLWSFFACIIALPSLARAQTQYLVPIVGPDASLWSTLPIPSYFALGAQAATPPSTSAQSLQERFLAGTTMQPETQEAAKNVFRYSVAFPANATAELTITLQPNQFYKPTPQESKASGSGSNLYALKAMTSSNGNSVTVTYFVPYSSLSPGLVQQLRAMVTGPTAFRHPTDAPHLLLAAFRSRQSEGPPQMGGQESGSGTLAPLPNYQESNGQGDEGLTFSEVLSFADTAVQAILDWVQQNGGENPALENLGEGLTDSSAVVEAIALNDATVSLITQVDAWQYCADNPAAQNPGSALPGATPGLYQSQADQTVASIKSDVAMEFVSVMDKLIATSTEVPGLNALLGALNPFEAIQNKLQASAEDSFASLRHSLASYCAGTWYGTFVIKGTMGGVFTSSDTGTIHFSVNRGTAKGTISGNFNLVDALPGISGCTGQVSYQGVLNGTVVPLQNFSAASLRAVSVAPPTFVYQGVFYDRACSDTYKPGRTPTEVLPRVVLIDGYPNVYNSNSGVGAIPQAMANAGNSGSQTVIVHELKVN
jgi:hypothetical protein